MDLICTNGASVNGTCICDPHYAGELCDTHWWDTERNIIELSLLIEFGVNGFLFLMLIRELILWICLFRPDPHPTDRHLIVEWQAKRSVLLLLIGACLLRCFQASLVWMHLHEIKRIRGSLRDSWLLALLEMAGGMQDAAWVMVLPYWLERLRSPTGDFVLPWLVKRLWLCEASIYILLALSTSVALSYAIIDVYDHSPLPMTYRLFRCFLWLGLGYLTSRTFIASRRLGRQDPYLTRARVYIGLLALVHLLLFLFHFYNWASNRLSESSRFWAMATCGIRMADLLAALLLYLALDPIGIRHRPSGGLIPLQKATQGFVPTVRSGQRFDENADAGRRGVTKPGAKRKEARVFALTAAASPSDTKTEAGKGEAKTLKVHETSESLGKATGQKKKVILRNEGSSGWAYSSDDSFSSRLKRAQTQWTSKKELRKQERKRQFTAGLRAKNLAQYEAGEEYDIVEKLKLPAVEFSRPLGEGAVRAAEVIVPPHRHQQMLFKMGGGLDPGGRPLPFPGLIDTTAEQDNRSSNGSTSPPPPAPPAILHRAPVAPGLAPPELIDPVLRRVRRKMQARAESEQRQQQYLSEEWPSSSVNFADGSTAPSSFDSSTPQDQQRQQQQPQQDG